MSTAKSENTTPQLVFRIPLEPARLLRARERMRDFLHAQAVPPTAIHRLVLAIEEAMSNAVLHSAAEEELEVELHFEGGDVVGTVRDRGKGFAVETFDGESVPDVLSSRGRGLYLIAKLTDEMQLRSDDGLEVRAVLHDVVSAEESARRDGDILELQMAGTRHQELRQRMFLEEMDESFAALDWEYRYLYVNAAALEVSGRSREELLGRTLWEAFPDVRGTEVEQRLREAMELGIASRYEFYFEPLAGWFEQRLYPTSYGLTQFTININERKARDLERERLMDALQAQGHFLEGILGSLSDGFVTIDEDWRYTFVNEAAAKMIGASPADLLGTDMWELTPAAAGNESYIQLHRAMTDRVGVEYEVARPDLGRWYRGKAYPLVTGGLALYVRDVTERVRAERAREQSDRRYRDLVQSANSAILRWTRDGTITLFNECAERMFGWSADEAVGRNVGILLPDPTAGESDLSGLIDDIVAHPERYVNNTNENVRKDGSRLWVAWTNRATLDDQGRVAEVLAVGNDVSELVRAEAALGESEEKYRNIVETTAQGVLIGQPDGRIVYANRQMAEMLGYTLEELLRTPSLDLVLAEWKPKVMANRAVLDAGEVVRGEMPLRRKDGSTFWTWYSSSAMFDATGKHIANLSMHSDITDRVEAEQALQRKAQELEIALQRTRIAEQTSRSAARMLAEVSDAVIAVDAHLHVTYMNKQAARLYGVDPDSALGMPLREIYDQVWLTTTAEQEALDELALTGHWRGDNVHIAKDGRRIAVESMVSTLTDDEGAPAGMLAVIRDITERERAERALREKEAEAAALAERNRLARDLHDSVTQALFAASLKAEALMLASDEISPHTAETVREVRRLTRGALAQMRTMLLELRSDPLEAVPIQQLLRNAVEATESRASVDVGLTVRGDGQLPPRLHAAVYRIVEEALNNVVRHSGAANAWVELDLEPGSVHLLVGDDGRGFEPSLRDPTRLGLTSMRERAAEVGADFRITTAPNKGTVVTVDWPGE